MDDDEAVAAAAAAAAGEDDEGDYDFAVVAVDDAVVVDDADVVISDEGYMSYCCHDGLVLLRYLRLVMKSPWACVYRRQILEAMNSRKNK